MLGRSLAENYFLPRLPQRLGMVQERVLRDGTTQWIDTLAVKTQGPNQPIGDLSGGNQQKIAIARLLAQDCQLMLLDEPTRGVDVGAKADMYRLINQAAEQGRAVIMVSSYLPEVLSLCDRVLVMSQGCVVANKAVDELDEQAVMRYAIAGEIESDVTAGKEE